MDIFESLENLPVSEACFEDIIGIVEAILSEDIKSKIIQVYGEPEYDENTGKPNKTVELLRKITNAQMKEREEALERAKAKSSRAWNETLLNRGIGQKVGSRVWQDNQIEKALDRRDEREWNKTHGWDPRKA